ncbi:MAG: hypothetical protein JWQ95_6741 [Sphaerisporangium sp.]|jgi:hypothetical protein|nr:hypothetical protein [Sphaerisporangium sp.]
MSLAWRVLKIMFRIVYEGLAQTGYAWGMTPSAVYVASLYPASRPLDDDRGAMPARRACALPPGHPERMAADVPPSAVESRLWAQLTKPGQ